MSDFFFKHTFGWKIADNHSMSHAGLVEYVGKERSRERVAKKEHASICWNIKIPRVSAVDGRPRLGPADILLAPCSQNRIKLYSNHGIKRQAGCKDGYASKPSAIVDECTAQRDVSLDDAPISIFGRAISSPLGVGWVNQYVKFCRGDAEHPISERLIGSREIIANLVHAPSIFSGLYT